MGGVSRCESRDDCSTAQLACGLKPGAPSYDPAPPDGQPFTGHFTFRTHAVPHQKPQDIAIHVTNPSSDRLTIQVFREGVLQTRKVATGAYTFTATEYDAAAYRIEVARRRTDARFGIRWSTNLTFLTSKLGGGGSTYLKCKDETDDVLGDDEIRLRLFDDAGSQVQQYFWEAMDRDETGVLNVHQPFLEKLRVDIAELKQDDPTGDVDNAASLNIGALAPDQTKGTGSVRARLCGPNGTCAPDAPTDVGNYDFTYSLVHSLDP